MSLQRDRIITCPRSQSDSPFPMPDFFTSCFRQGAASPASGFLYFCSDSTSSFVFTADFCRISTWGNQQKIANVIFRTTRIFYAEFAFFRAAEIISDCC